jgi:hypothetical protein
MSGGLEILFVCSLIRYHILAIVYFYVSLYSSEGSAMG